MSRGSDQASCEPADRLQGEDMIAALFAAEIEQHVLPNGGPCGRAAYDGAVTERPPGAMEKRHLPESHFYVRAVGVRTALQGPLPAGASRAGA
jgi:hypothetical protein